MDNTAADRIRSAIRAIASWRPRFTLRGILAVTAAIAVGCTMWPTPGADGFEVVLATVTVCVVFGMLRQSLDLFRAYRECTGLTTAQRNGWRWTILWRLVGSAILTVMLGLQYAINAELIKASMTGPPLDDFMTSLSADSLLNVIYFVTLTLVWVSVLRRRRPREPRHPWQHVILVAGIVLGVLLCALVLREINTVTFLVYLAIHGIEAAEPLQFSAELIESLRIDVAGQITRRTLFALVALFMSFVALARAVRALRARRRSTWIWGAVFVGALGFEIQHMRWYLSFGLPRLSPTFSEATRAVFGTGWAEAAGLLAIASAAAAYVLSRDEMTADPAADVVFTPQRQYLHENPMVTATVVVAGILWLIEGCWDLNTGWSFSLLQTIGYMFLYPDFYPYYALGLAALYATFATLRPLSRRPAMQIPGLPLARFLTVWLATWVAAVVAIPVLAIFGFAMWL